jgi:hypothetical protein
MTEILQAHLSLRLSLSLIDESCLYVFFFTEILAGSVLFLDNADLCFEETIAWKDILTGEGAQVVYKAQGNKTSIAQKRATCKFAYVTPEPVCHSELMKCMHLHCSMNLRRPYYSVKL